MKRILKMVCLLALCVAVAAFIRPHSLSRQLEGCTSVRLQVSGGFSDSEERTLTLTAETPEFEELKALLAPYTYHPTLSTLFHNTTIVGPVEHDITMYVFNGDKQTFYFHSLGRQKTWINNTSYHVGYFDDDASKQLADTLMAFAEKFAAPSGE